MHTVGLLLGGLGLLLTGMSLMTEGLKMAAGSALRDILSAWTSTRWRGLVSGFGITALVQSSSAVTVATIGFANASLLTLQQAVWVIFGSNVGTTMTGWIVALVGFKLNVESFALPMVGIGVVLKLFGERNRAASFGQALVGFGLLFLGIGVLKETFEAFGQDASLPVMEGSLLLTIGVYTLAGVLLTTVMQSSSAALVIALSAAEGGLIPLQAAAAVVIGANLGTTTTALIAVWGATATAKRVALSHVGFNIVTALVAAVILSPMLFIVEWVRELLGLAAAPATTLAIFHTAFNALGVALMWPLADRMVTFLSHRFQTQEEIASRPQFLDRTSLGLPYIASEAILNEVNRINDLAASALLAAVSVEQETRENLDDEEGIVRSLGAAVGGFAAELGRTALPPVVADLLPGVLRSTQQFAGSVELAQQTVAAQSSIGSLEDERLNESWHQFRRQVVHVAEAANPLRAGFAPAGIEARVDELDHVYEEFKQAALREGVSGRLGVVQMDALLRYLGLARRAAKLLAKAAHRMAIARLALNQNSIRVPTLEGEVALVEAAIASEDESVGR